MNKKRETLKFLNKKKIRELKLKKLEEKLKLNIVKRKRNLLKK